MKNTEETINALQEHILELLVAYLPKVLLAIITLIIGLYLIKFVTRLVKIFFDRKDFDRSLESFIISSTSIFLKIVLIVIVATMIGVETTSIVAVFGAASFAIGMALSGTLQNFAAGLMILLFKPFRVGDFIQAEGHSGTVSNIEIFNTILKTPDNKTIVIPNSPLFSNPIVNYSAQKLRRIDLIFGIGYQDDIDVAKNIILELANSNEQVMESPEPFVGVKELADSSVNLEARIWVRVSSYWEVRFYLLENVKKEFDKKGITIPFPQRDINVYQAN